MQFANNKDKSFNKQRVWPLIICSAILIGAFACVWIYDKSNMWPSISSEVTIYVISTIIAWTISLFFYSSPETVNKSERLFMIVVCAISLTCFIFVIEDLEYTCDPANMKCVYVYYLGLAVHQIGWLVMWVYFATLVELPKKKYKVFVGVQIAFFIVEYLFFLRMIIAYNGKTLSDIGADFGSAISFPSALFIISSIYGMSLIRYVTTQLEKSAFIILTINILFYILNAILFSDLFVFSVVYTIVLLILYVSIPMKKNKEAAANREFASRLQQAALNASHYDCGGEIDFYASVNPAEEVGGDFYDIEKTDDRYTAVLIADVVGHGIVSAMFMMEVLSAARGILGITKDPKEVIYKLNEQICRNNDEGMFTTMWLGIIDTETGVMNFVDAGHGLALVRAANGEIVSLRREAAFPLGISADAEYKSFQYELQKNDTLILYSDGIVECSNSSKEFYGTERFKAVLSDTYADNKQLCDKVMQSVAEFRGGESQADDITILAFSKLE